MAAGISKDVFTLRWAPRQFIDHKVTRMGLSLMHLMRFDVEGVPFLHRVVTRNEICVHHVTPGTKQTPMSSKNASSPPHKKFRTAPSAKVVMTMVFWNHKACLY
ncbi:hypothetical protein ANN_03975 [Periplaneta americana]|uniref:Uncharacterized protein n=1 Tax=Periplaneta americana TaxID=6978 RepID=A0ABQ8T7A6_PERAM|nr:hypothetical protein ANN_03975 [Periplaneta americana]